MQGVDGDEGSEGVSGINVCVCVWTHHMVLCAASVSVSEGHIPWPSFGMSCCKCARHCRKQGLGPADRRLSIRTQAHCS